MLRSVDFKYCVYREGELRESLVNIHDDPGELKNLATAPEHANTLNEHRRLPSRNGSNHPATKTPNHLRSPPDPRVTD